MADIGESSDLVSQAKSYLKGGDCENLNQKMNQIAGEAPGAVVEIQNGIIAYDDAVQKWNDNSHRRVHLSKISESGIPSYGADVQEATAWEPASFDASLASLAQQNGGPFNVAGGEAVLVQDGLLGVLGGYDGAPAGITMTGFTDFAGGLNAAFDNDLLLGDMSGGCSWDADYNDSGCKTAACDAEDSDAALELLKMVVDARKGLQEKQKSVAELLQGYYNDEASCDESPGLWDKLVDTLADAAQGGIDAACKGAAQVGFDCPDEVVSANAQEEIDNIEAKTDPAVGGTGADTDATRAAAAAKEHAGVRNFKEQCYLLTHMVTLGNHKKLKIEKHNPKKLPYRTQGPPKTTPSNACLMAQGPSYGFINTLTQPQSQAIFFNMENKDISTLMPMIEFYKIHTNPTDPSAKEWEQKYEFDSNATRKDLENLFKTKTKRGFGVGIKDFEFTYEGSNPFAAKKSISAKLTIFANDFDELLMDRGGYSYIELALKTGGTEKSFAAAKSALDEKYGEDRTVKEDSAFEKELKEIKQNLTRLSFRLKATVGWAMPTGDLSHFGSAGGFLQSSGYSRFDLKNGIYDSFMTLNLTPTTHEFDIDQQGRVNFTINYLAYVDDYFDQPNFNIFSKTEISLRTRTRALKYKNLQKICKTSELAAIKSEDLKNKVVKRDKEESLFTIVDELIKRKKMRYIAIKYEELINFQNHGPFASGSLDPEKLGLAPRTLEQELKDLYKATTGLAATDAEDDPEKILRLSKMANHEEYNNISFFYVSDLMDIILEGIDLNLQNLPAALKEYAKESIASEEISEEDLIEETQKIEQFYLNYKKFRLLLGPLEIVDPKGTGKTDFINFGDIPISSRYFAEWMTEKLIKKEQAVYPLTRFLTDFFNTLIRDFLNSDECFQGQLKQKTRLNQAVITSYNNSGQSESDEITEYMMSPQGKLQGGKMTKDKWPSRMHVDCAPRPILNIYGSRDSPISNPGSSREINYLTFFAGRTQPTELMQGDREQDERRGIFHYVLGKNRGIVKTIQLSKTNAKFLKELRFEQEGYNGLEQLREVYDINATTYANVHTFPGTYIFVDPRGFAPGSMVNGKSLDLTQFGIGGYCMIIRSTHKFGSGVAESSITAKWVASIGATGTTQIPAAKNEGEDESTVPSSDKRCATDEAATSERLLGSLDMSFLDGIMEFDMDVLKEWGDTVTEKVKTFVAETF